MGAFEAGDVEAGRAALNAGPILSALGVSESEKLTAGSEADGQTTVSN